MVRIPRTFRELSVPLPPMLLELVGVGKEHRFVFLYYWYGKPTWSDGESCTGFPFYTVWQPYIQHQAMFAKRTAEGIAHQLQEYDFGSNQEEPTHALVCDALTAKVYVAPFGQAIVFLNNQQEQTKPIAALHWQSMKAQAFAYTRVTFDVMQKVGMLEMCLPPTPEHMQQARELVSWLDKYV